MTAILTKIEGTKRFKHFIWRRHDDRHTWAGYRSEVVATDGRRVRRIVAQPHHILFQQFVDPTAATRFVSKMEENADSSEAFIGYSVFEQQKSIALFHTGIDLQPGWMALPYDISSNHSFPTLPLKSGDHPSLRLIGGGVFVDNEGPTPYLRSVLEQSGTRFKQTAEAFNILDHIVEWRVIAQKGSGPDAKEIRLALNDGTFPAKRRAPFRMERRFALDPILYSEFKNDPELRVFFEIRFDAELMCLPKEWLVYWFQLDLTGNSSA